MKLGRKIPMEFVPLIGFASAVITFGGFIGYKQLFKDNQVYALPGHENMYTKYHKEGALILIIILWRKYDTEKNHF